MNTRIERRFRKRIPCRLNGSRSTFSGLILDVSRMGLFVQTSAAGKAGEEIRVQLAGPGSETPIVLDAQVVWHRRVPHQLRSIVEGGLGLQIRYAPEPYYLMLAEAAEGSSSTRGPAA